MNRNIPIRTSTFGLVFWFSLLHARRTLGPRFGRVHYKADVGLESQVAHRWARTTETAICPRLAPDVEAQARRLSVVPDELVALEK